ncbi:hypothetical protein CABS01_00866 [Colletotrichum abscissum]|uniref:uncharacterized protein n=1 Tax=Colletotrichum abscissum TaxID=1671311 RepID=UPI0027D6AF43|nr:uncharacterized protein CABS01_00866 [Colletotrichum abscissum]KAK1505398.1 hypothetical protein CABS01_00866 [Colletotrichum abscissum]
MRKIHTCPGSTLIPPSGARRALVNNQERYAGEWRPLKLNLYPSNETGARRSWAGIEEGEKRRGCSSNLAFHNTRLPVIPGQDPSSFGEGVPVFAMQDTAIPRMDVVERIRSQTFAFSSHPLACSLSARGNEINYQLPIIRILEESNQRLGNLASYQTNTTPPRRRRRPRHQIITIYHPPPDTTAGWVDWVSPI